MSKLTVEKRLREIADSQPGCGCRKCRRDISVILEAADIVHQASQQAIVDEAMMEHGLRVQPASKHRWHVDQVRVYTDVKGTGKTNGKEG